jgi:hypothetical protein
VEEEPPPLPKLRTGSESLGADVDAVLEPIEPTEDSEDIAIELQRKRSRPREIDLGQPSGCDTMYEGRRKRVLVG